MPPETKKTGQVPQIKRGLTGFKIFLIILFSFLGITVITAIIIVFFTNILAPGEEETIDVLEKIPLAELSSEQERLIDMLGYPDEFVITLDRSGEVKRVETWLYSEMDAYFIFQDGIYEVGDRMVTPELEADSLDIKPEDFNFGMTKAHINRLMGYEGQEVVDPSTGFTLVEYSQGRLLCSFDGEGTLVAVNRLRKVASQDEK